MRVKITQVKSIIGSQKNQKETIKALGLNKIGKSVEKDTNDMINGMIAWFARNSVAANLLMIFIVLMLSLIHI